MKHLLFSTHENEAEIAILVKESALIRSAIQKYYVDPLEEEIPANKIVAFTLKYNPNNKIPAKQAKEYLSENLLPALSKLPIKILLVADAAYFKYLSGAKKTEDAYGYIYNCIIPGYEYLKVVYTLNHQALVYNPAMEDKIITGNDTVKQYYTGTHKDPGSDIVKTMHNPKGMAQINLALMELAKYDELTCDIESTDLRFDRGQLYTISFAWNKHEGVVFQCTHHMVKDALKSFFIGSAKRKQKIWFHNALFDAKFLIYHLFMEHSTDYKGMKDGIEAFKNVQDTMLYTYLALNSTADIKLGLKANSHEYTGKYALDDEAWKDITTIPIDDVLRYNLIDSLATWYVKEKYEPIVIADDQMRVYDNILQPSIAPLLEMMLVGLPLDLTKTKAAQIKLEAVRDMAQATLKKQPLIHQLEFDFKLKMMREDNAKLKRKLRSFDDYSGFKFNPASNPQVQYLLYDLCKLPVIDLTKTKQPSTGQKTLVKLQSHTTDPEVLTMLDALIHLAQSSKILNDFIANFQALHFKRNDDTIWLNGDQVLGGTQSGRLSARNPNLANLPSNSIYGKTIKSCFVAPEGWLFGGADFSALEDKIGAILSGDEMKTKEFTQGMDGHSVRAIAFFGQLEEPVTIKNTVIDPKVIAEYDMFDVESVNRFKEEQSDIRQEAKAPSFALQYGGTKHTLHKNIGLPLDVAEAVENGYHKLYWKQGEFSANNAAFAQKYGYVECAFGLRLRTPLLSQTILGMASTPREAESEARSSSNAVSQSWGMLSNRAAIEIQERINSSPYKYDIFLVNQIHDAIYFVWKDEVEITKWLNDNLVECMEWQDDPKIQSDEIKLGAELDLGYSWDKQITVPNKASLEEIQEILKGV